MNSNMFDKLIDELRGLEAQIAAINARPFMPETPSQISIRMRHPASRNRKHTHPASSTGTICKKPVKSADHPTGR